MGGKHPFYVREYDSNMEDKILVAVVTNDFILNNLKPMLDQNLFVVGFVRKIIKWVVDYHNRYGEAPKQSFLSIVSANEDKLSEDEFDLLSLFIEKLEKDYEFSWDSMNTEYFLDLAIKYLRKRKLMELGNKIISLAEQDELDKAEGEFVNFMPIGKISSDWINPNDPETIKDNFRRLEKNRLLTLPGPLGEEIGPLERGWVFGIMAPPKTGKTMLCNEIKVLALRKRLKVAEFNLEMSREKLSYRYYSRLMARTSYGGNFKFPLFDCKWNQNGECSKKQRKNKITLGIFEDDRWKFPSYGKHNPNYKPCDYCRHHKKEKFDYSYAVWYDEINKNVMTVGSVQKFIKGLYPIMGENNYRLKCYPRSSASIEDFKRDLDILWDREGFLADIIIIDYPEITKPVYRMKESRDTVDETWKGVSELAQERQALLIAPTLSNREGAKSRKLKTIHTGEDFRKVAHLDKYISLSRSSGDKKKGISRVSVLADRHGDSNEDDEFVILQAPKLGQMWLDSEKSF